MGMMKGAIAHLSGVGRFDFEVEGLLNAQGLTVRRNLLTDVLEIHGDGASEPLTDERLSEIRFSLCYAKNGQDPAKDKVADALALIGERRAYHPVRDYLSRLEWDGEQRLDTWLCRFAGADDTPLVRAYARKILCAAVRRATRPGCKFDHVLVLQGSQGIGKSMLVKALCDDPAWFTDQAKVGADAKETIERTRGAWLVELAELDGLSKKETNAVKSFITTVQDRARPAYARYTVEKPRQFILFGTTNEATFLTDMTGNRRWWIVPVRSLDVAGIRHERDQLWAEAVAVEPEEKLWLDTDDLRAASASAASDAFEAGPWFELIDGRLPDGPLKLAAKEAWALVGIGRPDIHKTNHASRSLLRKALAGHGFDPEPKNLRRGGAQVKAYVRGDVETAPWWGEEAGPF